MREAVSIAVPALRGVKEPGGSGQWMWERLMAFLLE